MLPRTLRCTGQPPTTVRDPAPKGSGEVVEALGEHSSLAVDNSPSGWSLITALSDQSVCFKASARRLSNTEPEVDRPGVQSLPLPLRKVLNTAMDLPWP